MSDRIESLEALEALVGKCSLGARMKEIDFLDAHCRKLLAASTFVVSATLDAAGRLRLHAHGGAAPFARIGERGECLVPVQDGEDAAVLEPGADGKVDVGALAFVPGLGETLRINGRGWSVPPASGVGASQFAFEVREAFIHCAKALIRSRFWAEPPPAETSDPGGARPGGEPLADPTVAAFLARSPFALVASASRAGAVDVSPKGDPPGFLLALDARTLVLPDRPGNQRVDTFRNVLETERVALLALVPGDARVAQIEGRARLTTEPALLARMAVDGRFPKLALVLDVESARVERSTAVAAADLWSAKRHSDLAALPSVSEVLRDHVKLNPTRGVGATLLRTAVSKRVIEGGLAKDYKERLY